MDIKGNGKIKGTNLKKKILVFSENEQEKYGVDSEYKIETDIWKSFSDDKLMYIIKFEKDDFKVEIVDREKLLKVNLTHNHDNKLFSIDGKNDKQKHSRMYYRMCKQSVIWLEEDEENDNEKSYMMARKKELLNHNEENIGDILDKHDLKSDVKKMAEFLGFPEIFDKLEKILFEGRLGSAAGQITFQYASPDKEKVIAFPRFKINPRIPNNQEGLDEYFNTIKHELAHAITEAGDGTKKFERFCGKRDIGTSHNLELSKYTIYCKDCGEKVASRSRKSKLVKSIMKGESLYTCSGCGGNLEVVVNY